MQSVALGDNLHEMLSAIVWKTDTDRQTDRQKETKQHLHPPPPPPPPKKDYKTNKLCVKFAQRERETRLHMRLNVYTLSLPVGLQKWWH